jgi:hypothetical protein
MLDRGEAEAETDGRNGLGLIDWIYLGRKLP